MSEQRTPSDRWLLNAKIQGKKTVKIELYPARLWRGHAAPNTKLFSPKLPTRLDHRAEYFEGRYRVRLDGRWLVDGARFTMLERDEIINRFLRDK